MESYSDESPFLVAQAGPLNGQSWIIRKYLILGREADCDIVISDRQVSRHHASLTLDSKGAILEDLGSKNGTLHNGTPLTGPIQLEDGDIFQIALAQKFVYVSSDSTIPLENPPSDLLEHQNKYQQIPDRFDYGRLRLESKSRQVWIQVEQPDGSSTYKEILPPLSVSQFHLLEVLYKNPGQVIPRPELVAAVWGEGQAFDISEQALDALVRRLRDRIASLDSEHEYIITVRGHGLRLENPPIHDN